jgi:hypothetical protein
METLRINETPQTTEAPACICFIDREGAALQHHAGSVTVPRPLARLNVVLLSTLEQMPQASHAVSPVRIDGPLRRYLRETTTLTLGLILWEKGAPESLPKNESTRFSQRY